MQTLKTGFCQQFLKPNGSLPMVSILHFCLGRQSTLVQETQRAAQAEILSEILLIESVFMSWPNRHYFLVDFTRFPDVAGLDKTTGESNFRIRIAYPGCLFRSPSGCYSIHFSQRTFKIENVQKLFEED